MFLHSINSIFKYTRDQWLWGDITKCISFQRTMYSLLHYRSFVKWSRLLHMDTTHADVIKWKLFPHYWPFVRGSHRSPVNPPHRGHSREALMFSLICALNKRLSKQSWGWWFETPSGALLRHCNEICGRGSHKMSSLSHAHMGLNLIQHVP